MNSGSGLVETWIPDGGFEIQRRKAKTPDGGTVVTECLVPKWSGDDLTVDHPLHRQPCLHRVLATCRHDQIVAMANNYGLLTVTVARKPEPGKPVHAATASIAHRRAACGLGGRARMKQPKAHRLPHN